MFLDFFWSTNLKWVLSKHCFFLILTLGGKIGKTFIEGNLVLLVKIKSAHTL